MKAEAGDDDGEAPRRAPRTRNDTWAELMRRVFAVDSLECPECQGRMRILAAIHSPSAFHAILECLGLPARPPPIASPDPDPDRPDIDHVCPAFGPSTAGGGGPVCREPSRN